MHILFDMVAVVSAVGVRALGRVIARVTLFWLFVDMSENVVRATKCWFENFCHGMVAG
jgi:hypothetical protein